MQICQFDSFKNKGENIVLALGFFECVHIGHRELLKACRQKAEIIQAKSACFTFDNNPQELFGSSRKLIYSFDERCEILSNLGLDYVLYQHFDSDFCAMSAEEFLDKLFRLNIKGIVCGFDFTYGKGATSNAHTLLDACQKNNIPCEIIQEVRLNGKKVSSSRIYDFLIKGNIEDANTMLGEKYRYAGIVNGGVKVGRTLGFPTVNLRLNNDVIAPNTGVYSGEVVIDGKKYNAVINVGARPTFFDNNALIEAHIIGFEGDLYGKCIRLFFNRFIRSQKVFDSKEQLSEQISKDVLEAQNG
jgi:riboflavin kinase/FMN adenylyltransferase